MKCIKAYVSKLDCCKYATNNLTNHKQEQKQSILQKVPLIEIYTQIIYAHYAHTHTHTHMRTRAHTHTHTSPIQLTSPRMILPAMVLAKMPPTTPIAPMKNTKNPTAIINSEIEMN